MVTVFNVGQGDSILLHPEKDCIFTDVPLLVDCGPKGANVHLKFEDELIDVLITHSHQDHIGGIINVSSRIRRLFIPYYLPEIWRIFNYLSAHLLSDVESVDLRNFRNVVIVGEGDMLCNHLEVLNPPKWPHDFLKKAENNNLTIREALAVLRINNIILPEGEIIDYISEISQLENVLFGVTGQSGNIEEYLEVAQSFVHNFFISLAKNFEDSTEEIIDINEFIQTQFENYIHQACIVFNYTYLNEGRILFTGDANKKVFNRLIKKGTSIRANYLKVPHHGSQHNLNNRIIHAIMPDIAIISHDNGLFGRAIDPHPNIRVLSLLNRNRINMHFTNDVKKGLFTPYYKTVGAVDSVLEFK